MMTMLKLAMNERRIVEMIYIDNKGNLSQRFIKVLKINGNHVTAFCFLRKNKRTFNIDNILSVGLRKQLSKIGA